MTTSDWGRSRAAFAELSEEDGRSCVVVRGAEVSAAQVDVKEFKIGNDNAPGF